MNLPSPGAREHPSREIECPGMANEGWEGPSLWKLGERIQRARHAALEVGRKLDEDRRPGAGGSGSVDAPSAAHPTVEG